MYGNKPRIVSSIVVCMILLGLGVYHVYAVGQLREQVEQADENIEELEQEQINYSEQNKTLSEELEELESTHLQELEKIETYEEKMENLEEDINQKEEDIQNKESEIDKLNKDLQSKREREEEEARLAKEASKKESDKTTLLSSNNTSKSEQKEETKSDSKPKSEQKEVVTSKSSDSSDINLGTFDVTYYSAYDGSQIGITRGGTNMANGNIHTSDGYRIIASDLSVIPLGTIVRVTTGNGESFLAKVDDSGGAIVGNKIDIAVSSPEEAFRLGRTTAKVEIVN